MSIFQSKATLRNSSMTLLQLLIIQYYLLTTSYCCPFTCVCKWKNGKQTVDCTNRGLLQFPTSIDPGTQVLVFSSNTVPALGKECFLSIQLLNLQKIYLSKCQIGTIDDSSFKGLKNLVELDLSENRITSVPRGVFADIPLLMKLTFNTNPINRIESFAFKPLIYLTFLDLGNCQLDDIELQAFSGLESLEILKLDNNRLKFVPGINTLPSTLHGIDLNNNQWLCDCKLVDFHQWLTLYNVPQIFDPKCHRPLRLKNHEIRTILKGDLACLPEVSPTAFYLETGEGKNISLNCKVIANPPAEITWWFQGRPLVLQDSNKNTNLVYALDERLHGTSEKISELAIFNLSADESNGTFNCVANNSAGKSQANFTIRILVRDEPTVIVVTFPYDSVVVAIIGAILLVFSLVILLVCVFVKCARRSNRCQQINKNHLMHSSSSIKCPTLTTHDSSDNEQKIESPEQQIQDIFLNPTTNAISINLQQFEKETFSPNKRQIISNIDVYKVTSPSVYDHINPDLINDTTEASVMNGGTSTYFLNNDECTPLEYGVPKVQLALNPKNVVQNNHYYRTLPYKRKAPNGYLLKATQSHDTEFYNFERKSSPVTGPYYCSTNIRYTADGYPELQQTNDPNYHQKQIILKPSFTSDTDSENQSDTKTNLALYPVPVHVPVPVPVQVTLPCCNIPVCYTSTHNQSQIPDSNSDQNNLNLNKINPKNVNSKLDPSLCEVYHHHCHHHCHPYHHHHHHHNHNHHSVPQNQNLLLINGTVVSESPDEGYVGESTEI